MTHWKRFDPYVMPFDESEQNPSAPAKVANAAKVSSGERATPLADVAPRGTPYSAAGQQATSNTWSPEDWRAFFDERAAIAEHDRGLTHAQAEAEAFAGCVVEWLKRHSVQSSPIICCWCGGIGRQDNELLPFGTESVGHTWLHSNCWRPWRDRRGREAVAGLTTLGITDPEHRIPVGTAERDQHE
jgi:hypothetical protein